MPGNNGKSPIELAAGIGTSNTNWVRLSKKMLIVDSDVMWVTSKELSTLLGQPFGLPRLSTILLLFFNFRRKLKE